MDRQRFLDCLDADFHRLRDVAAGAELDAAVPSCPGWTMADLLRHVGEVYLDKVECIRQGRTPDPWPPAGLSEEPPFELLDRSYAALTAELAARPSEEHAFSWYEPDQTVGFWVRRMPQETVIHRVDAELAAGVPLAPIPDDLATDGVAEVLVVFVQYATRGWPDEFAELLASAGDRTVRVGTPDRSWLLRLTTRDVRVVEPDGAAPAATVEGLAPDVLLWLWSRGGSGVMTTGDEGMVALLRKVLVASTQ